MKTTRFHLPVVLCVALGFASIAEAATSYPDVVFGNMGSNGSLPIGSTNTDVGVGGGPTLALAQGFTTGASSPLVVQKVVIGAFALSEGTVPRTVAIYDSVSNAPGSPLFTSLSTAVGDTGKYAFDFTGATLSPSTNYWIVPDYSVNWSWYWDISETTQPTTQNGSGYSYLGTRRMTEADVGTWNVSSNPYSLTISAVPEPSTIGMAVAGMAIAGFSVVRRRRNG